MPIDLLSGTFAVKTRAQARDEYLRDYRSRIPDADTSEQTQPFVDASNFADGVMPIYANAQQIALATSVLSSIGKDLDADGNALGIPRRGASPSIGYLVCAAATGGAALLQGQQFRFSPRNLTLECLLAQTYFTGDLIPVHALSTGPATNLPAGTSVSCTNPPPGLFQNLLVFKNTDGTGLEGGSDVESDDDYRKRLLAHLANPPANENEQAVVELVENIPGLAVQKIFVWSGILGPATKAVFPTMIPSAPGQSRQPNAAQLAILQSVLQDGLSGDDGVFIPSGADHLFRVSIKVTWKIGGSAWADQVPWPAFSTPPVLVMSATSAGLIDVGVASGTISPPTVGNTIAFYNAATSAFVQKRISAVTTVTPNVRYTLAFDLTTPGASDTNFVPAIGAVVSPWSASLTSVVAPLLAYIDKQGPGEMVASFSDPGRRQRRFPVPTPDTWPSKIENRMVDGLFSVVSDALIVEPTIPFTTTVGTPGTLVYLHRASDIGVFAE